MEYRKLGQTDIDVSTVAMGCWAIVGDATWGDQNEAESIATVEAAIDAGITFFDTAEMYGNGYSEEILGKVLPAHRKDVVIASKFTPDVASADEVREACERSLKRLKTDYLDLYQIHWPRESLPFDVAADVLQELLDAGKVRSVGISNFGVKDMTDYFKVGRAETNQLAYNMFFRALEFDILPKCQELGVGVLCYSPLAQGLLTGKFKAADDVPEGRARTRMFSKDRPQSKHSEEGAEAEIFEALHAIGKVCKDLCQPMGDVALAWLIAQPGVTSVLAGARNVSQAKSNARAGDLKLSVDALEALDEATEAVKAKLGPNPDMWFTESRIQ